MFLYCTSQGVDIVVKWLISLAVTSNHKCLNKIVFNKLALIIFEPGTQPQRWYITTNDMKAIKQTLQDITTCIGHLQQNRSPQPIPPTNNVNPTNQGNNNTQGRGRGFYRGRRGRVRGRGQNVYQDRPPICWWCKGKVSETEAKHRIKDCPIYNQCRENWWKTHPSNSNTTIPSNPKQEEN